MPINQLESDLRDVFSQQASSVSSEAAHRITSRNYRPRVHRRTRTRRIIIGGVLAGAAATVALAAPMPWNQGAGLSSAAFAVTPNGNGAITVETTWSKLHDPSALQAALDRAGARTKLYVTGDAPNSSVPACIDYVQASTDVRSGAVTSGRGSDDGHLDVTVRPTLFPPDATMVVIVDYLSDSDGNASTTTYFATGSLPSCAPTSWNGPNGGGSVGH